jgi:hypothetical protein
MGWCNDVNYPKKYNKLNKYCENSNMKNFLEEIINMIY